MHLVIAGRAVRVLFQGYLERFGLAHGTQLWSCQRLHCATVPDITLWLCRARLRSARLRAYRLLSVSEAIDCCTGTLSVECVVRVAAVQPPFCGAVTQSPCWLLVWKLLHPRRCLWRLPQQQTVALL